MTTYTDDQELTMQDAHTIVATMGGDSTHGAIVPDLRVPVQAMFKESAFVEIDDDIEEEIKAKYGEYATEGSAGIDLRYVGSETLTLKPGEQVMVSTGLAVYLNDPRLVGKVYPRSGRGIEGLVLGNLTGIIDSDYQNEIKLCLWNRQPPALTMEEFDERTITIEPGERVAQYMVIERVPFRLEMVEEFSETTERGLRGFGSSGKM